MEIKQDEHSKMTQAMKTMTLSDMKRTDYLKWEDYFMSLASISAMRSKDPKTQVGAAIVTSDFKVVGLGYNGMPIGCDDDKMPWGKDGKDLSETKHGYVCHAEMNAIINKNTHDISGSTMYSTHFPCNECAKLIIQSRIKTVVYLHDKKPQEERYKASALLLTIAGVKYEQFKAEKSSIVINLT